MKSQVRPVPFCVAVCSVWADEPNFSPRGQPSTSYRLLLQLALSEVHGSFFALSHLKCKKIPTPICGQSPCFQCLLALHEKQMALQAFTMSVPEYLKNWAATQVGGGDMSTCPRAPQHGISQNISCPSRTSMEALSFSWPRCPHCVVFSPFLSKPGKVGIARLPQLMLMFFFPSLYTNNRVETQIRSWTCHPNISVMSLAVPYSLCSSKCVALGSAPFKQNLSVLHWRRVMWSL